MCGETLSPEFQEILNVYEPHRDAVFVHHRGLVNPVLSQQSVRLFNELVGVQGLGISAHVVRNGFLQAGELTTLKEPTQVSVGEDALQTAGLIHDQGRARLIGALIPYFDRILKL